MVWYPLWTGETAWSAAASDVRTTAAALIAPVESLPGGGERVQLYRALQDVTIAAKDTLTEE